MLLVVRNLLPTFDPIIGFLQKRMILVICIIKFLVKLELVLTIKICIASIVTGKTHKK